MSLYCRCLLAMAHCHRCNSLCRGVQTRRRSRHTMPTTQRTTSQQQRWNLQSSTLTKSTPGLWCSVSRTDTDLLLRRTLLIFPDRGGVCCHYSRLCSALFSRRSSYTIFSNIWQNLFCHWSLLSVHLKGGPLKSAAGYRMQLYLVNGETH